MSSFVESKKKHIPQGRLLPLKFWLQVTYPLLIAASLDTFCLIVPQRYEPAIKMSIMANRKFYTGFPTNHQSSFYAAPNFLKMGIKVPRFVVFWTTSTIKDEKSAAKFHYVAPGRDQHSLNTTQQLRNE